MIDSSRIRRCWNLSLAIVPVVLTLATPTIASADRFMCRKFQDHTMYVWNGASGDYAAPVQEGIQAVDSNSVVNLVQVGGYGEQDQQNVNVQDYGPTGWAGISLVFGVYDNCIHSWSDANLNQYYLDSENYAARRNTTVHEIGHSHGLSHVSDPSSPMYTNGVAYVYTAFEQGNLWDAYCPSCSTVALRLVANNLYVAAEYAGGTVLNANRSAIGPWEIFKLHDRGGGWYALQARDGRWVRSLGNGGGQVFADATMIGQWETYLAVPSYGGYSLMTSSGYYLTAAYGYPQLSAQAAGTSTYTSFIPVF